MSTGPSEFATWEAHSSRPPLAVKVRPAVPADAERVTTLHATRNGLALADVLPRVHADLSSGRDDRRTFVAVHEGQVVAYGRIAWLDLANDPEARSAPSAWYLTGLVVDPPLRRRGIGHALTRARLDHLFGVGVEAVWYFASAVNRVTVQLHEQLGFREVRRDFRIPGVTFTGGEGILFRVERGAKPCASD